MNSLKLLNAEFTAYLLARYHIESMLNKFPTITIQMHLNHGFRLRGELLVVGPIVASSFDKMMLSPLSSIDAPISTSWSSRTQPACHPKETTSAALPKQGILDFAVGFKYIHISLVSFLKCDKCLLSPLKCWIKYS